MHEALVAPDMFSLVHVILPVSELAPAEAIRASLAPFERGGKGEVPDDWLAFHDETDEVRALHRTEFTFTRVAGPGSRARHTGTWTSGRLTPRWRAAVFGAGRCASPTPSPTWTPSSAAVAELGPVRAYREDVHPFYG
ncbi:MULTISPECIES: hypothetical protein [unclassified Methylobacterium]|uniref:hypothetical protein n=1 Tax=unclassified Methylobacterium TaxID=2615210 RepID=UPI00226AEDD9|nr:MULTISPECIES: hypothetical protein [unclassified Methylobacterium]